MPISRTRSSSTAADGATPKRRAPRTTATKKTPVGKSKAAKAKAARIRKRPVATAADTITTEAHVSVASAAAPPGNFDDSGSAGVLPESIGNAPNGEGLPLIDRVERSIECEISRIEEIIGGRRVDAEQQSDAERRARTLASLTRTLFELRRLRDTEEKRPLDDDTVPRDLDELRRALSQRLDQMVAGAEDVSAAGDE